jgi:uncharacterized protein
MKIIKLKLRFVKITTVLIFFTLISCHTTNVHQGLNLPDKGLMPGDWHFSGHLGKYIDKISEHRILDLNNWNVIYPETEEAFRLREDDKNYPKRGEWRGEFWGKYILSAIAACHY